MRPISDWIGYQLLMWLPLKACDPDTAFGAWVLVHAGNHAYRDLPDVGRR